MRQVGQSQVDGGLGVMLSKRAVAGGPTPRGYIHREADLASQSILTTQTHKETSQRVLKYDQHV